MTDETERTIPPSVSHTTLMSQVDRLRDEGIPTKIDKHFLIGMSGGTQYQFRHALRTLGFITEDDRPTPLLEKFVHAEQPERSTMFGEIMTGRFPELMNLPGNASKSDLLGVLQGYGVTSADQQRKILAFYVAAADFAGLPTSPHVRPSKARTGPRRPRTSSRAKKKPAADPQDPAGLASAPSAPSSQDEMRAEYFALLIKNANEGTKLDRDVLNRIERLVGLPPADEEEDRDRTTAGSTPATPAGPASQEEG